MQIILASQNRNKLKEFLAIFEKKGISVISRDDAGLPQDEIEENGETFEENSETKAQSIRDMIVAGNISQYLDSPVIADDSGLMVDALDGAPGVYSARYAGNQCDQFDNNIKLLNELDGIENREACFVAVITMIFPDGRKLVARGECPGSIAKKMRGEGGFGYDPLFIPKGYDKTFSELGPEQKNKISHRAMALLELERLVNESDFNF